MFVAAEKGDDGNIGSVADQVAQQALDLASQIGTDTIVVYPYAHLSSALSSPRVAVKALDAICKHLEGKNKTIMRAPFGYYKAFEIDCKGHPLSELAKTVTPSGETKRTAGEEESQVEPALLHRALRRCAEVPGQLRSI